MNLDEAPGRRYAAIELPPCNDAWPLGVDDTFQLLANVAQPNTQWSAVIEMQTRTIDVATGRRFERVHQFKKFPPN